MKSRSPLPLIVRLVATAVTAGLVTVPVDSAPRGQKAVERVRGHDAVSGDVIVRFRNRLSPQTIATLDSQIDADKHTPIGHLGARLVHSRSFDTSTLLAFLENQPDVEYAEPNYLWHATDTIPNDPSFTMLWGLNPLSGVDIRTAAAWTISRGSSGIAVGVIDTGIDYTHPDLVANIWSAPTAFSVTIDGSLITCPAGTHGYNAIADTCDPMDDHSHGTHVTGTIGARGNNGIGVVGVNWVSNIIGGKFLDSTGWGTTHDAVKTIDFMLQVKQRFGAAANVRVLSNSWIGGGFSQTLLDAISLANANDMLFVVAAGNEASSNDALPQYPSSYLASNVVSVASTTNQGALSSFSNYGVRSVDLGAPGSDILSTTPSNTYSWFSGTSMATPHVAGAAALVLAACTLDTAALKSDLLTHVTLLGALSGITVTGGLLNVDAAIRSCGRGAGKGAPANGATGLGSRVALSWQASTGASSYEYCRDTINNGACDTAWTSVGAATSIAIDALATPMTYFWQVRARNLAGTTPFDGGAWWSFKTAGSPGPFAKLIPQNLLSGRPTTLTLTWSASLGATSYEYCRDTTNDGSCDTTPTSVGASTSVILRDLVPRTTYYWQVRARNPTGTTLAGNAWWSFKTAALPGRFDKIGPANGATGRPRTLPISWSASTGATSYEYCGDTINNATCDNGWTSAAALTSIEIRALATRTTYYWQVRARSPAGTVAANGGTWRSFTTR